MQKKGIRQLLKDEEEVYFKEGIMVEAAKNTQNKGHPLMNKKIIGMAFNVITVRNVGM